MPKRKITKKEFKQEYKPWVTRGILTSIRRKDKLLKKFIRTKNHIRKQIIHNEYKTLRNQIIYLTRKSKHNFYQNSFNKNNTNLRKVWQGIKEIINIKEKHNYSPVCVMENNDLVTDSTDVSNSFNKYCPSIAENILNNRNFKKFGYLEFDIFMHENKINLLNLYCRLRKSNFLTLYISYNECKFY